jgi:hypothetical protein
MPGFYWVERGRLLGGEYPGAHSPAQTQARLKFLLAKGVTYFLDLTEPGELPPYDALLPAGGRHIIYVRKPMRDHSVPAPAAMAEILEYLQRALGAKHCVYLHCRAGIGRTGTVMGCHLIQGGMSADQAVEHLNQLWRDGGRGVVYPQTPETDQQLEFVRAWRPVAPRSYRDL